MKVNAYRCDRCEAWVEEVNVTHAVTVLKGRRTGRHAEDLCESCAEKVLPSDAEPARQRGPRRNAEQIAEALQTGGQMLSEGASLEEVCAMLNILPSTWKHWLRRPTTVSASRSASSSNSQPADKVESGV